nr:MAG TPA: hypothetical protein [Caudoviricetes sp.]
MVPLNVKIRRLYLTNNVLRLALYYGTVPVLLYLYNI